MHIFTTIFEAPPSPWTNREYGFLTAMGMLLVSVIFSACGVDTANSPDFGLPKVELDAEPNDWSDLNNSFKAKEYVPATLTMFGSTWAVSVRYSGATSLDAFKRSYQVKLPRDTYFRGHNRFRLAAFSSDETGLRTLFGFHLYQLAGLDVPKAEPVALYVRNKFAGLYYLLETIDEEFFAERGIAVSSYFQIHHNDKSIDSSLDLDAAFSPGPVPSHYGDLRPLLKALESHDSSADDDNLKRLMNTESFFSHLGATVLLDNWDGFNNNIFIYNRRDSQQFQWVPWDMDSLLDRDEPNMAIFGRGEYARLTFTSEDLRRQYLEWLGNFIETKVSVTALEDFLSNSAEKIASCYTADSVLKTQGNPKDHASIMIARFKHQLDQIQKELQQQTNLDGANSSTGDLR